MDQDRIVKSKVSLNRRFNTKTHEQTAHAKGGLVRHLHKAIHNNLYITLH